MIIPQRFELAGIYVDTIEDNTLVQTKKAIGEARYAKQTITLDLDHAGPEVTEQSYLHEVTHWILYVMGEEKLRNNEKFVDLFAQFWYQYEKTKRGDIREEKETTLGLHKGRTDSVSAKTSLAPVTRKIGRPKKG